MKKILKKTFAFHVLNAIIFMFLLSSVIDTNNEMSAYMLFGAIFINGISMVSYPIIILFFNNYNIDKDSIYLILIFMLQNTIAALFYQNIPFFNFLINMLQGNINDSFKIGFCFNFSIIASFYFIKMLNYAFNSSDED